MYCVKCGSKTEDGSLFCTNCGARLAQTTPPVRPPVPTACAQSGRPSNRVSFGGAIKLFFQNYANFTGRASRSEYWWFFLFNFIVSFVLGLIPMIGWIASGIYSLAMLIGGLSLFVRRLHDTGRSWPYMFIALIPLAGPIILLVWLCQASGGDNRWGTGPWDFAHSNAPAPAPAPASGGASGSAVPCCPREDPPEQTAGERPEEDPVPTVSIHYAAHGQEVCFRVDRYPCTIGRDGTSCEFVVEDTKVSRVHAQLYLEGHDVYLKDLGSSNGTQVHGESITAPTELLSGDDVVIGTTRLLFEIKD